MGFFSFFAGKKESRQRGTIGLYHSKKSKAKREKKEKTAECGVVFCLADLHTYWRHDVSIAVGCRRDTLRSE